MQFSWRHFEICSVFVIRIDGLEALEIINSFSYSKNPHKRTSALRALRLKFGQQSTTYIRTKSA